MGIIWEYYLFHVVIMRNKYVNINETVVWSMELFLCSVQVVVVSIIFSYLGLGLR